MEGGSPVQPTRIGLYPFRSIPRQPRPPTDQPSLVLGSGGGWRLEA
jgi:hypothetical protein